MTSDPLDLAKETARDRIQAMLPAAFDAGLPGFKQWVDFLSGPFGALEAASIAALQSKFLATAQLADLRHLAELRDLPKLNSDNAEVWRNWVWLWSQTYLLGPTPAQALRLAWLALEQTISEGFPWSPQHVEKTPEFASAKVSRCWTLEDTRLTGIQELCLIENPLQTTHLKRAIQVGQPFFVDNPYLEAVFPTVTLAGTGLSFPVLWDAQQARALLVAAKSDTLEVVQQPGAPNAYTLDRPTIASFCQPDTTAGPRLERLDDQSFVGGFRDSPKLPKWNSKSHLHPAAVGRATVGRSQVSDAGGRLARWLRFSELTHTGPWQYRHGLCIQPGGNTWVWLPPERAQLILPQLPKQPEDNSAAQITLSLSLTGTRRAHFSLQLNNGPEPTDALNQTMDRLRSLGIGFSYND